MPPDVWARARHRTLISFRYPLQRVSQPVLAGLLVFLIAFGVFAATTNQLPGYEPETAAVTAGLVEEGHLWGLRDPEVPSLVTYLPGRDGHTYGRTGLLQPLLEVPFFVAGRWVDAHLGLDGPFPYRLLFLWFYNPFVGALAAVAMFALVYLTRRSVAWASALAALFILSSVAWPYAKIGMETTFMFAILAAFALAAWARIRPAPATWAMTGFAAGATAATKPYSAITLLPLALFLWPAWAALDRRRRLQLLTSALLPLLAWAAAIGWYNWARFGSPADFGYSESSLTLSMPLNVFGLLFSPGKGLIFYSPLVVLGALSLARLWREDPWFAAALASLVALLTCVSGASTYWGDEVWGPRYVVPVAWALLVPIAWWCDTAWRRRALAAFAVFGTSAALIGVSGYYGQYVPIVQKLSGVQIYNNRFTGLDTERIPYGDDPPRWIPQLSPLLLQGEGLLSSQVLERIGMEPLTVSYVPFEGRHRSLDFSEPPYRIDLDFFWKNLVPTLASRLFALAMLAMALASAVGLYRLASRSTLSSVER
jgi:hypothetical protein